MSALITISTRGFPIHRQSFELQYNFQNSFCSHQIDQEQEIKSLTRDLIDHTTSTMHFSTIFTVGFASVVIAAPAPAPTPYTRPYENKTKLELEELLFRKCLLDSVVFPLAEQPFSENLRNMEQCWPEPFCPGGRLVSDTCSKKRSLTAARSLLTNHRCRTQNLETKTATVSYATRLRMGEILLGAARRCSPAVHGVILGIRHDFQDRFSIRAV